jgi:hypothetical protein
LNEHRLRRPPERTPDNQLDATVWEGTDKLYDMRKDRAAVSLAEGAVVGLTVASLVGIPQLVGPWSIGALLGNAFSFWGLVLGGFAAVTTAGISFALLNRRDRKASRRGRTLAGITLAVFAVGTVVFGTPYGFPSPLTLEGLWFYPLVLATTAAAVLLLRRKRPNFWDQPPST